MVEVISKECIKPSSPIPFHLKTHKLSLLDQIVPAIYTPITLFYPREQGSSSIADTDIVSERSSVLKQSLSETLTRFYPFAGTIKDNRTIDCNDAGAHYVVSRIKCSLSDYLKQPDLALLNKFIPGEAGWVDPTAGSPVTLIQENTFQCGGIVIGFLVSHLIADGSALSSFLKHWAATARGFSQENVYPNIDAPFIFPQSDHESVKEASVLSLLMPFFRTEKAVARRFWFDVSAIAEIKAKATSSRVENPSRVEAVSALICKRVMAVFKARSELEKQTLVTHTVNMRRRAVPPFPESTIGNLLWVAAAVITEKVNIADIVSCLREAISKADGEFVKNLQGEGGLMRLCEMMKQNRSKLAISNEMDYIGFTSWCNFGLYDVDFGWGKPSWVSVVGFAKPKSLFINSVLLMDTPEKGIEAWMFLGEDDIVLLEHDEELLSYASVDPSPV